MTENDTENDAQEMMDNIDFVGLFREDRRRRTYLMPTPQVGEEDG